MWRPRIIPVLLLQAGVLVKSIGFKKHRYIGDPLNAVRLFNDLAADELLILDISASAEGRAISVDMVAQIGEEAKMPFGVGGGFRTLGQVQGAIAAGAEKVVIGAEALRRPEFISEIAGALGASSVSVCLDVKPDFWGKPKCWIQNGRKSMPYKPVEAALLMQQQGAGEIILQSVPHDGAMEGYDIPLLREVSNALTLPVVALGGAGNREHLVAGFQQGGANALAGGSIFIYQSSRRGVLINYLTNKNLYLQ